MAAGLPVFLWTRRELIHLTACAEYIEITCKSKKVFMQEEEKYATCTTSYFINMNNIYNYLTIREIKTESLRLTCTGSTLLLGSTNTQ